MNTPATATRTSSPPSDDVPSPPAELVTTSAAAPARAVGASATPAADERRMTFLSSPSIGFFIEALALAQLEFTAIEKDLTAHVESKRTGAKYSYGYADLGSVIAAVRPALNKQGIGYLQPAIVGQRTVTVTTLLAHKSGEFIRNDFTLPIDSSDPQAIGSAITYARRYALQSLLGIAPEEGDDDARAAGGGRTFQDSRERGSDVRPGRGPVQMPQRAEVAAPPSPGAPPTSSASPTSAASTVDTRRPGPVPVASAPKLVTITKGPIERKTTGGKPYWLASFSNGQSGCTFSTTMRDKLLEGVARGTRYSKVVISAKGNYTYIDELFRADDEGGVR